MKTFFHLSFIWIIPFCSSGQLILGGSNPQEIVQSALAGPGVSISNIQYTGSPEAIAYFSANTYNMPFHSGFLMSTGSKFLAVGPNDETHAGVDNGYPGTTLMDSYINVISYNAAILSFDLIPSGDTLKIKYIFGSEEFPEFAGGAQYTDAFAILVQGQGISGTANIAKLPNNTYVATTNFTLSSGYYVGNGNSSLAPYNNNPAYLQYDGLTIPLTAKVKVQPNKTYHVTIVIIDGGDALFDSGVFIEEGGITAGVGENSLDNFVSVFYNSTNQQATIQVTEFQQNLNYSIVDLSGKVTTKSTLTETTSIDLSDYSSGMYVIHIEGTNGKISKKIIR